MDYVSIIRQFINPIISSPDKVVIEKIDGDSEKHIVYLISCTPEDTGRLIGKRGATAEALREVLSIAAKDNNQRVHIKLTSLQED